MVPAAAGDLFDGSLLLQDTGAEMWEIDKPGRKMMVMWGADVDMFDPETQVDRPSAGLAAAVQQSGRHKACLSLLGSRTAAALVMLLCVIVRYTSHGTWQQAAHDG